MTRFLLAGFASEFPLRPLAHALTTRGYAARAIDLAEEPLTTERIPPGDGPLVLITSLHTVATATTFRHHHQLSAPHYAAPETLRDRAGADLVVFVPHDLLDPVLPAEVDVLATFDLFASPDDDHWWVGAHCRTVRTGWIGHLTPPAPAPDLPVEHGVLFITADKLIRERGGGEYLLEAYRETLATGIAVKLAVWPGSDALTAPLLRAGVPMIVPETPAAAVIAAAPLVASNAPSSVLAEAVLVGHRPICVAPASDHEGFRGPLAGTGITLCEDAAFADHAHATRITPHSPALFDLDALLAAIDRELDGRAGPSQSARPGTRLSRARSPRR